MYILIEHGHIWNSIGILATSSKPPGPTLTNLRCMATSNATWAFDGAVASRWWCCQWTPFWGTITILTSLIQPTSKIATLAEFHSLEAMINRQRLPNEECRISSILNQPSWSAPCFFWVPCLGGKVCWASASPWVLSPFGGRLRWAELLPNGVGSWMGVGGNEGVKGVFGSFWCAYISVTWCHLWYQQIIHTCKRIHFE